MAKTLTYKDSGVDIAAGDALAQAIGKLARSTFSPRVVKNEMGFAGLFRLDYNERLFKKTTATLSSWPAPTAWAQS